MGILTEIHTLKILNDLLADRSSVGDLKKQMLVLQAYSYCYVR